MSRAVVLTTEVLPEGIGSPTRPLRVRMGHPIVCGDREGYGWATRHGVEKGDSFHTDG